MGRSSSFKETLTPLVIVLLVGLFLMKAGVLPSFGLFSTVNIEPGTHNATLQGHNWSIDSPWGVTGYLCNNDASLPYKGQYQEDRTDNQTLYVYGQIPNSGSSDCGTYGTSVSVRLEDVDVRQYAKVIIRRNACVDASGKDRDSRINSNVMGLVYSEVNYDNYNNWGSVNKCFGDVVILNEGGAITVIADEGRQVFVPTEPFKFSNSMSASSSDVSQGSMNYRITGVELTPFCPAGSIGAYPSCVCPSGFSYDLAGNKCSIIVPVVNQTTNTTVNQTTNQTVNVTTSTNITTVNTSTSTTTAQNTTATSTTSTTHGQQSTAPVAAPEQTQSYIWLVVLAVVVIALVSSKKKR